MLSVVHNLTAQNAQRQFNTVNSSKNKSTEKLSSGYKINRSADDAAGLAISEKMRRQIRGLTQGTSNCQDGISLCQVADGAMAEVHDMLQRMNELCIKSANGTLSSNDRSFIDDEIQSLKKEIDRIGNETTYNEDILVLQGKEHTGEFEYKNITKTEYYYETEKQLITVTSKERSSFYSVSIDNPFVNYYFDIANSIPRNWTSWSPPYGFTNTYESLSPLNFNKINSQEDWKKLDGVAFFYEAPDCRPDHFAFAFDNLSEGITDLSEGSSVNSDSAKVLLIGTKSYTNGQDFLSDIENFVLEKLGKDETDDSQFGKKRRVGTNEYLAQENGYLIVYSKKAKKEPGTMTMYGVNWTYKEVTRTEERDVSVKKERVTTQSIKVPIYIEKEFPIQFGFESTHNFMLHLPHIDCEAMNIELLSSKTEHEALGSIAYLKDAISYVSSERSRIGAYTNELKHLIAGQNNTIENTSSSESAIRDTDMASEMLKYSLQSILSQAASSVLAQANQSNQSVLSILS